MTDYLTEQQQVEQFKIWWKKHGLSTLAVFIIALAGGLGWRYWIEHREIKLARGSSHYESLLNALVNGNNTIAVKEADLLKQNYTQTPYAALATLVLARNEVYQQNYSAANQQLQWVIQHGNTASLKEIARLRLAQINLQQQQPQQALNELKKIDDISYQPLIDEIQGDSYVALSQWSQAQAAYQKALTSLPNPNTRPLLRMKLDNLATHISSGE